MMTDTDKQYVTLEEARDAIEKLGQTDHVKLMIIARSFCRSRMNGTVIEPDDLLQEAITKTLEGKRRWNKEVSIIKHLDRVMESDSGHLVAQSVAHGTKSLEDYESDPADSQFDPDARISAKEKFNGVLGLFEKDKIARDLLVLKSQGFWASEIQRELGIEKVQYETITKRIRRNYAQYLVRKEASNEKEGE